MRQAPKSKGGFAKPGLGEVEHSRCVNRIEGKETYSKHIPSPTTVEHWGLLQTSRVVAKALIKGSQGDGKSTCEVKMPLFQQLQQYWSRQRRIQSM
jgi:hypothetical protein